MDPSIGDDLRVPFLDVAIVSATSHYSYPTHTKAFVSVHKQYLQDYATSRDKTMVHVYFADAEGEEDARTTTILGEKEGIAPKLPGRLVDVRRRPYGGADLLVQIWGVRHLISPKDSPITEGRWEYGSLKWAGGTVSAHTNSV